MKDQVAVIRPLPAHSDSTECGEQSIWRRGKASVKKKKKKKVKLPSEGPGCLPPIQAT
jgi:hypothetical protein